MLDGHVIDSCLTTCRIPKLFSLIAKLLPCFVPYTCVSTYIQSFKKKKKKSTGRVDTNIKAYTYAYTLLASQTIVLNNISKLEKYIYWHFGERRNKTSEYAVLHYSEINKICCDNGRLLEFFTV